MSNNEIILGGVYTKLTDAQIKNLALIVTGDSKTLELPYRNGESLINFFNSFGFKDEPYWEGTVRLPNNESRGNYTKERLKQSNGTKLLESEILSLVDENSYFDTNCKVDLIAENINKIIRSSGYCLEKVGEKFKVVGEDITDDKIEVEACFNDIQASIIKEIRKAKYSIQLSVAWFTDKVLFDELKKKMEQGVNVQIIISNDSINTLDYDKYFETYRIDPFGVYDNNILHNKFCVIDLETVLEGSYNWSKRAQYNKENLQRIKQRENASKYADRFIELKLGK